MNTLNYCNVSLLFKHYDDIVNDSTQISSFRRVSFSSLAVVVTLESMQRILVQIFHVLEVKLFLKE